MGLVRRERRGRGAQRRDSGARLLMQGAQVGDRRCSARSLADAYGIRHLVIVLAVRSDAPDAVQRWPVSASSRASEPWAEW